MKTKFVADDGAEFDTSDLCLAYERLVIASKNKDFHKTVENLFVGCTSWQGGHGMDDDSYKVLHLDNEKDMAKFKINLVRALPSLRDQLEIALGIG